MFCTKLSFQVVQLASAVIKQTDVDNTSKQAHSVLSESRTPSSKRGTGQDVNRNDTQEKMQCAFLESKPCLKASVHQKNVLLMAQFFARRQDA